MAEDWRFEHSPHVEEGGLRAYAGVPLRFSTEFGEHVAFGSLCVASNSPQATLDKSQQQALARLADWIVADIVQSARLRRQRERRWMLELLAEAERQCSKGVKMEEYIPEMLQNKYPTATVGVYRAPAGEVPLEGGTVFKTGDLQSGLWEDTEYFDQVIEESNHLEMIAPRIIRVIAAQCASQRTPTFLLVGSRDFRDVFDDIDSWFIMMCASLLCRDWQGRALREALDAKESFLRGITHQLRTPIHGILGSVELLTEEMKARNMTLSTRSASSSPPASPGSVSSYGGLDPDGYIRTIRWSAEELMSTVNSIIKLNRWAGNAQADRKLAYHNVNEVETALLEDTSSALEDDPSKPSVVFYRNLPASLDRLYFDINLFVDCIRPLIVNAIQHTPGGIVAVILSFESASSRLIVDVQDTGSGIAPRDHKRIFEAYEKVNIHTTGAGLGLTLACKSAELMNGNITLVSSEIGQGSHFRAVFDDVVCDTLSPREQQLKDRLVHLPKTFYQEDRFTLFPSLRHCFTTFLTLHGYTASESLDDSFMLLDYTPADVEQVYQQVLQLAKGQIAICLVSESATFPGVYFQNTDIQRHGNVIYVKPPFTTTMLQKTLEEADAAIRELVFSEPASDSSQTFDSSGDTLTNDNKEEARAPSPSHDPDVEEVREKPELQHRVSIFPPSTQTKMVEAMQNLQIEIPAPEPSLLVQAHKKPLPMTLLVDDNAVNLRILEIYCKRRSMPYQSARDGDEAIALFSEHRAPSSSSSFDPLLQQKLASPVQDPFDLVLMDLQMPVCDGITATRRIREAEKENGWPRSVIIIVTGQDSASDRIEADEAGADGFLVKPVGPKVMDRWLKRWFPGADIG